MQTPRRRHRHPAARSRIAAGVLSVAAFLGIGAGLAARSAGTAAANVAGPTRQTAANGTTDRAGVSWSADPGGSVSLPLAPTTTTHAS
ncbi:MAG: hypothetical protein ACXVQJ_03580 [Actinomycetota bacterium]